MAGVVGLGGGGSRGVVVAEVRGAQRRDLRSGRNLVGLGAAVVVDGPLLGEEVIRELLVARHDGHDQVGGHGIGEGVLCMSWGSRER